MPNSSNSQPLGHLLARNLDKLTRNITYVVLIAFILILAALLIKAFISYKAPENGKEIGLEWLNLFRDGFLVLGGILTTLVGYYFGNRGSEAALKEAEEIRKETEQVSETLSALAPTDEDQDSGMEQINF